MDLHDGDDVLVNLAPFVGLCGRCREAIPCRVLAVGADDVVVRTCYPFREVSLRVHARWVEKKLETAG